MGDSGGGFVGKVSGGAGVGAAVGVGVAAGVGVGVGVGNCVGVGVGAVAGVGVSVTAPVGFGVGSAVVAGVAVGCLEGFGVAVALCVGFGVGVDSASGEDSETTAISTEGSSDPWDAVGSVVESISWVKSMLLVSDSCGSERPTSDVSVEVVGARITAPRNKTTKAIVFTIRVNPHCA